MVEYKVVETQLHKVGMRNQFFGRPEVRELCHILAVNENIQYAVTGQYEGGFALMVATDRRVLLIDKKPWFLTMEDIRYDMISEVDFYARLLDATVSIVTINKTLKFRSWKQHRLRELVRYIQHRVMEVRHIDDQWQQNQEISPKNVPKELVKPVIQTNISSIIQEDFVTGYIANIKRHSLAHIAGKIATIDFVRSKPIVKPLYPRPSLISRYRSGSMVAHSPIQHTH